MITDNCCYDFNHTDYDQQNVNFFLCWGNFFHAVEGLHGCILILNELWLRVHFRKNCMLNQFTCTNINFPKINMINHFELVIDLQKNQQMDQ